MLFLHHIIRTQENQTYISSFTALEGVKLKELEVLKINILAQLAFPFTKSLTVAVFKQHISDIGILPNLDA
jgi:hypothetical protein